MIALHNITIKTKLTVILMIASTVAVLLVGITTMILSVVTTQQSLVRNLDSLAEVIGNNSLATLAFNIPEEAENILHALESQPTITYACIFDKRQNIFAEYRTFKAAQELVQQKPGIKKYFFSQGNLCFYKNLQLEGTLIGSLYLVDNMQYLYETIRRNGVILAALMVIALSAAYLMSHRLQRFISQPILSLAHTAELVTKHNDYTIRAGKKSSDEIGVCIDSFNNMLSLIQLRDKELRRNKDLLNDAQATAHIGSWEQDCHTGKAFWSDELYRLLGYEPGAVEVNQELLVSHIHKDDVEKVRSTERYFNPQSTEKEMEYRFVTTDGSIRHINACTKFEFNNDGVLARRHGIVQDITERKWAEQKLIDYQNQLRTLSSQLTFTEERERRYFATYIHDRIGQSLFIVKIKLEALAKKICSGDNDISIQEIIATTEALIKDVRSLTFDLSPPILYQLGFQAALQWLCDRMSKQYGLVIQCSDDHQPKPLDEDVLFVLFRAVREMLINVGKHAQTQHAEVSTWRQGGNMYIQVTDDGVGFDPVTRQASENLCNGFGLFSIKERLDYIGGTTEIISQTNHGTRITLTVPLRITREGEQDFAT